MCSNLPIGFFSFLLILAFLKMDIDDNDNDRRLSFKGKMMNMDIVGALTLVAAVCIFLLALQWGGTTFPWNSLMIIGLFVGFGLILIFFVILQWRLENKASIPLRVLRQRSVLMGCFYTFFVSMSNYTVSHRGLKPCLSF
jgi:fatty acid desaturase